MLLTTLVLARLRSHLGRSLVLVVVLAVATGTALSALAVLRVADDPWAPLQAATRGADVEIDEAPARPDPGRWPASPRSRPSARWSRAATPPWASTATSCWWPSSACRRRRSPWRSTARC
jgi:hypothetical protein